MLAEGPTLPPGVGKLKGAVAGNGWILCWDVDQAAVWSPASGWTVLPRPSGQISMGYATDQGIVVLSTGNEWARFWAWGARDWSWSAPTAGLADCAALAVAGRHLLSTETPRIGTDFFPLYLTTFRIWSASQDSLRRIAQFDAGGSLNLVCAAIDHSSKDLIVACSEGLYRFTQLAGEDTLEKIADCSIYAGPFSGPAISGHGRAIVFPIVGRALEVDMISGHASPTTLGGIDGCHDLWRAYISGGLDRIPLILETLRFVPVADNMWDRSLYDLAIYDDLSAAAVTPEGILRLSAGWVCPQCGATNIISAERCPDCGAVGLKCQSQEVPSTSVADHHSAEVLSWRLLIDREQALPDAIDELLKGHLVAPELLTSSIAEAAGDSAGAMMFERARGRQSECWDISFLEGVQSLFGRLGPGNAELVRDALTDEDPAVVAVALAAAAVTTEDGNPLLWAGDHPIPVPEIRSLLEHASETVAGLAADACAALKLGECASEVSALLDHESSTVRRKAVESLGRLPSLESTLRDRIAGLIVADREETVREAAIEVTAEQLGPQKYLDQVIEALGDVHYEPRWSACTVLSKSAALLSADQFFRTIDIFMLLLMASNMGDQDDDFAFGVAGALTGMIDTLVEELKPDSPSGLDPVDPELAAKFSFTFLAALFVAPLTRGEYVLDTDGLEKAKAVFESIGRDLPLTEAEYDILSTSNDGVAPLTILSRAVANGHHRLAHRLAIAALFCRRDDLGRHYVETTESADDGYVPLHLRLRRADHASLPLAQCKELVDSESKMAGVASLPALYCLAATGDHNASEQLEEKIIAGEYGSLGIIPSAFMQLLGPDERRTFMERLLLAGAIPIWHRFRYFDAWPPEAQGELEGSVIRRFLAPCVTSRELGAETRLDAARRLADLGEPEALERYWVGTDPEDLDPDRLYEFSKDMARAGHAEHLKNVRGTWIDRGDLEALKAFAAVGTQDDLAELERALAEKAPERWIRDTMDAITERIHRKA